jgi:hypothetical protein
MTRYSPSGGEEIVGLFPGRGFSGNKKKQRARPVGKIGGSAPPIFGSQETKGERRIFLGENHSGLGLKGQMPDAAA